MAWYTKLDVLGVPYRLGLGLEFAFSRNRYRKSRILKNVMFALGTGQCNGKGYAVFMKKS